MCTPCIERQKKLKRQQQQEQEFARQREEQIIKQTLEASAQIDSQVAKALNKPIIVRK